MIVIILLALIAGQLFMLAKYGVYSLVVLYTIFSILTLLYKLSTIE